MKFNFIHTVSNWIRRANQPFNYVLYSNFVKEEMEELSMDFHAQNTHDFLKELMDVIWVASGMYACAIENKLCDPLMEKHFSEAYDNLAIYTPEQADLVIKECKARAFLIQKISHTFNLSVSERFITLERDLLPRLYLAMLAIVKTTGLDPQTLWNELKRSNMSKILNEEVMDQEKLSKILTDTQEKYRERYGEVDLVKQDKYLTIIAKNTGKILKPVGHYKEADFTQFSNFNLLW